MFCDGCTCFLSTSSAQRFQFLHVLTNILFSFFEKNSHFEDMKWYLILDLIYISMIASIVEHIFSCAY